MKPADVGWLESIGVRSHPRGPIVEAPEAYAEAGRITVRVGSGGVLHVGVAVARISHAADQAVALHHDGTASNRS